MRVPTLLLLTLAFSASAAGAQQPAGAASYHDLLRRVQAGDTTVDFTALRMAYAASPEYDPYTTDADEHRDSATAALHARDFPRAVKEADAAVDAEFLNARLHLLKAYIAAQSGDSATSVRERGLAERMGRSIFASGDGSQQHPFKVIAVQEEYALIGLMGYRPAGQSLGECGPHPCDVMEVTDRETGGKRTLFFDISLPMGSLERELGKHD